MVYWTVLDCAIFTVQRTEAPDLGRKGLHPGRCSLWLMLFAFIHSTLHSPGHQIVCDAIYPYDDIVLFFCSSNILLDSDLRAIIADFGFVSALPECVGSTTVVTAVGAMSLAWSRGYLAPEVADGKHGVSTDVYSYGVVGFLCVGMLVGVVCCGDCVGCVGIIHEAPGLF